MLIWHSNILLGGGSGGRTGAEGAHVHTRQCEVVENPGSE